MRPRQNGPHFPDDIFQHTNTCVISGCKISRVKNASWKWIKLVAEYQGNRKNLASRMWKISSWIVLFVGVCLSGSSNVDLTVFWPCQRNGSTHPGHILQLWTELLGQTHPPQGLCSRGCTQEQIDLLSVPHSQQNHVQTVYALFVFNVFVFQVFMVDEMWSSYMA